MYRKEKRGQVTIFIIIAILIVALAVIFYLIIPKAETTAVFEEKNPESFIQTCLEDEIEDVVETVSLQGGSLSPEHYFTYNNINIEYLCYTNQNVGKTDPTCIIQQPLLKQHVESEIENEIKENVVNCFNSLKQSYEEKGYNVNLENGKTTLELLPKRIVVNLDYVLTVSKSQTDRYDDFSVILNNNLYELISIANSIVEQEAIGTINGVNVGVYIAIYPDLKIEKNVREDETRIYVLTDDTSIFQFAVRSIAIRPGY